MTLTPIQAIMTAFVVIGCPLLSLSLVGAAWWLVSRRYPQD